MSGEDDFRESLGIQTKHITVSVMSLLLRHSTVAEILVSRCPEEEEEKMSSSESESDLSEKSVSSIEDQEVEDNELDLRLER